MSNNDLARRSFADLDALRLTAVALDDYALIDRVDDAIRERSVLIGSRRASAMSVAMAAASSAMTEVRGSSAEMLALDAYGLLLQARIAAARDDEAEDIGRRRMNDELDARIAELDARAGA